MTRLKLLDLFCCAGGAAMGYHRAGFDVVGVDINQQPRYPFGFMHEDAMEVLADADFLRRFDAIHASPPCQSYSANMKHLAAPQPMLVEPVRERLQAIGLPWVIENVEGAPVLGAPGLNGLYGAIVCGTVFGLRVWRHRWFESNLPIMSSGCRHTLPAMNPHNVAGRERIYAEFGRSDPEVIWRREMGVGWMNRHEAREAIPPAYTEFIGAQLLAAIAERAA